MILATFLKNDCSATWLGMSGGKCFHLGQLSKGPWCLEYLQSPRRNWLTDFFRSNEQWMAWKFDCKIFCIANITTVDEWFICRKNIFTFQISSHVETRNHHHHHSMNFETPPAPTTKFGFLLPSKFPLWTTYYKDKTNLILHKVCKRNCKESEDYRVDSFFMKKICTYLCIHYVKC